MKRPVSQSGFSLDDSVETRETSQSPGLRSLGRLARRLLHLPHLPQVLPLAPFDDLFVVWLLKSVDMVLVEWDPPREMVDDRAHL